MGEGQAAEIDALREALAVLVDIRRAVRRDPKLGRVVCIHDGSMLMGRIDAAIARNGVPPAKHD